MALTDGAGAVTTSYGYDPYGVTVPAGAANDNPFQFTGRQNDAGAAGLYYYRARYYNPAWGRFISEDPIGLAGGVNLYGYVGGDPVSYTDPLGNGKIGFLIKISKGIWRSVTKDQARRALTKGQDVKVTGPKGSKTAGQLAQEQFGNKTARHDGHKLQSGDTGMPHYQHKNGGRGHVFYTLQGFTFVGAFGDHWYTTGADLLNPISDAVDLWDLFIPLDCE